MWFSVHFVCLSLKKKTGLHNPGDGTLEALLRDRSFSLQGRHHARDCNGKVRLSIPIGQLQ